MICFCLNPTDTWQALKQKRQRTSTRIPSGREKGKEMGKRKGRQSIASGIRSSPNHHAMHPGNILKDDTRMHGATCYADEGGKTKAEVLS
jgi:hypothetical protein